MRIVSAIELDAKMTLVVGEYTNTDETCALAQVSIARSLKRIADKMCGETDQQIATMRETMFRLQNEKDNLLNAKMFK